MAMLTHRHILSDQVVILLREECEAVRFGIGNVIGMNQESVGLTRIGCVPRSASQRIAILVNSIGPYHGQNVAMGELF
jgi:hypothetical protein